MQLIMVLIDYTLELKYNFKYLTPLLLFTLAEIFDSQHSCVTYIPVGYLAQMR